MYQERWDLLMLLFAPYLIFFSGNVTNIPAVLQPSSTCQQFRLLTVCRQRFTHQPIVFCLVRPTHISLGLAMRAVSLFSSRSAALVSRVSRLRRSTLARACAPLTKSEEKERLLAFYLERYVAFYFISPETLSKPRKIKEMVCPEQFTSPAMSSAERLPSSPCRKVLYSTCR